MHTAVPSRTAFWKAHNAFGFANFPVVADAIYRTTAGRAWVVLQE